jgi:hypothetical protein
MKINISTKRYFEHSGSENNELVFIGSVVGNWTAYESLKIQRGENWRLSTEL